MKQPHTRAAFGTLTLIAIVLMVLLITGIGQALWRHSTQLGAYCRDIMLELDFNSALDTCDAIGQSIVSLQRQLEYQVSSSQFGDTMNLEEFSGYLTRQFSGAALGMQSPQGLNFLQSSAAQGDMGLMSQLQLGSLYGQRGDASSARYYYQQALSSLTSLQGQNSPASQQMLGSLPMPAGQMQQQLQSILSAR